MNTLLTVAWLSYTLGLAPVALFDGRVPEVGWEVCSTSQAPITVYDGPRERSSVGLTLEYRDGSGWCYSTWPGYHMTDPITVAGGPIGGHPPLLLLAFLSLKKASMLRCSGVSEIVNEG